MQKNLRHIIESWVGFDDRIHAIIRREEKLSVAMSNTGLLCRSQFDALCVIAFLNIHNVTAIAQRIGCSKSATSIMISKMAAKELVKKVYGHNVLDNRSVYIEITPLGEEVIEDFMQARITVASNLYDKTDEYAMDEIMAGIKEFKILYKVSEGFLSKITKRILQNSSYTEKKKLFLQEIAEFIENQILRQHILVSKIEKEKNSLTTQQYAILNAISKKNKNTVSKLVDAFGTSVSTVSVNVSRLARAGYIVKEYSKTTDNRVTILSITDKAQKELTGLNEKLEILLKEQYNSMNNEQKKHLEKGLIHFDNAIKFIKAEVTL